MFLGEGLLGQAERKERICLGLFIINDDVDM